MRCHCKIRPCIGGCLQHAVVTPRLTPVQRCLHNIYRYFQLLQDFVGDKINAGIYVLSPDVLNRIELRPTSIEREVFPHIAADNKLYAFTLPGYWMDVGQPKDYLKGVVWVDELHHLTSMCCWQHGCAAYFA